ncbi:uncharacterized protein LOC134935859 isoform X2 [Pseudophryne corroboree]|uniref:uncharacterized protein LOC134935859 isoform X2 n=1 Tax=Pseudophryne corroboree TaxID=495146 RepID=UPI003081F002
MASADLRQELDCSICLRIYTDPVTLRCGHNFCRVCIDRVLDTQKGSGAYSCPECRAKSKRRPALKRNITLCKVVESFRSIHPDQEETGIFCTYCIHSPVPAAKSCLMCEAHLCDNHLRVHSKSPEHVLSDPTAALGNRKCSVHKRILEYYCSEDTSCICVSCCLIGEHRGHKVESLDEASEKKEKLRDVLQKLSTKRADAEKKLWSLQERRREDKGRAAGVTERVTALFSDIRRQLEDLEKRVLSEIFRQEERVSRSVSDLIQQLEVKKEELSRKMRHIEELCNMSDPVTVIQEPDTGDLCNTEDRKRCHNQVHDGGDLDVGLISGTLHTLSDIITYINRGIYVQEATDPLLDVTTAVKAECNITVSYTGVYKQEATDITDTYTGVYKQEATDITDTYTGVYKQEATDITDTYTGVYKQEATDITDTYTGVYKQEATDTYTGVYKQEATDTYTGVYKQEATDITDTYTGVYKQEATDITDTYTGVYKQEATDITLDVTRAVKIESEITTGINPDFSVQEPVDIVLDALTAGNNMLISDDGKTASVTRDRFQYPQAISTRGFSSGRHYWDVDVHQSQSWRVGMCYPSIDRKGHRSYIGENSKSWCLRRCNYQNFVIHDGEETRLPDRRNCNRVRIYLDYEAGLLSFNSLCGPIRHLYTYNTTFTEPLHAALWLWSGYSTISGVGSEIGRNKKSA